MADSLPTPETPRPDRHMAFARLTTKVLADELKLPKDAQIFAVYQSPEMIVGGTFLIYIEHPDLPTVPEGDTPREIYWSIITEVFEPCGHKESRFEVWG